MKTEMRGEIQVQKVIVGAFKAKNRSFFGATFWQIKTQYCLVYISDHICSQAKTW